MPNLHDPSDYQESIWKGWYLRDVGPDPLGRWLGWCPLHTRPENRDPQHPNATINFSASSMTCLERERDCFSGRKSSSLDRITSIIAARYLQNAELPAWGALSDGA